MSSERRTDNLGEQRPPLSNIAIFASGGGSNFEAIVRYFHSKQRDKQGAPGGQKRPAVSLLICNQPDARVVERARRWNVPLFSFRVQDYASQAAYEAEIVRQLALHEIDFIVLAGYMRLL